MSGICWLAEAAEAQLRAEAGMHPSMETGGLLLGYWVGDVVTVTDIIGPGPQASRTATSFVPDAAWQAEELARRYVASGRLHTYLGDWHTHPGGGTGLSRRDRRTLAVISRHPQARQTRPLFGVLAPDDEGALTLWRFRSRWHAPVPLVVARY